MDRRRFLKQLMMGAVGPLGLLGSQSLLNLVHAKSPGHQRRLVLVELAGANDGLNTLVPFRNDDYYRLRPNIGLSRSDIISLNDAQGMHQRLRPLLPIWEEGNLAWIQGLGYPNANRSHFASIALWEAAGDGFSQRARSGWITHAIEHQLSREISDPHGISLSGDMDIFASDTGRWLSLQSLEQLSSNTLPKNLSINSQHSALALVQSRLSTLSSTMSTLASKVERGPTIKRFRGGAFGEQLRQVARLVTSGVETPVYRVRLPGFDTHQYQIGQHARLMGILSAGLADFIQELKSAREWENTLVFTYSEFGRRVSENSSQGTDHGTAAPHMLLGGAVNGGLYSDEPSLSQLLDDDLKYTMDYRSVYRQLLVEGLSVNEQYPFLNEYVDRRLETLIKSA